MSEQQDPAKALLQAFGAAGRGLAEWIERMRPAFEQFAEVMSRPDVVAAIERAQASPLRQRCHCLCGIAHAAEMGVCDGEAVLTRRVVSPSLGAREVPVCAPCAAAQGIVELARS